jgi:hypothetical protein
MILRRSGRSIWEMQVVSEEAMVFIDVDLTPQI